MNKDSGKTRRAEGPFAVTLRTDGVELSGEVAVPSNAEGLVILVHGSGRSHSRFRRRHVARRLEEAGLATLRVDLLTRREDADDRSRFDMPLLAHRLESITRWAIEHSELTELRMGYLGASLGAAAAMVSTARMGSEIAAVVSHGGRPDLAGEALGRVRAPTLLVVGDGDAEMLRLNRRALEMLGGKRKLVVVPGGTHLLAEAGVLDEVVRLATGWFRRYLSDDE